MDFLGQLEVFFLSLAKIQILYYIGNQFVIKFLFFLRQSLDYVHVGHTPKKRVTQKRFCVTLKRLSSKPLTNREQLCLHKLPSEVRIWKNFSLTWTHPNPLHPLLGGSRTYPVRSLRDFLGLLGHPPPLFIQVGAQKCDTRKLYSVPPDKPYMRGQASVLSVSMFTI